MTKSSRPSRERGKGKPKEGDVMRVKGTDALVRLKLPENPNEKQVLIDDKGYVYVKPVEPILDWYHIDELEES